MNIVDNRQAADEAQRQAWLGVAQGRRSADATASGSVAAACARSCLHRREQHVLSLLMPLCLRRRHRQGAAWVIAAGRVKLLPTKRTPVWVRIRRRDSVKCPVSPGAMMPIRGRNRSSASPPPQVLARPPHASEGRLAGGERSSTSKPHQRPPQPQHRLGRDRPAGSSP
jgi:hypothetical protein